MEKSNCMALFAEKQKSLPILEEFPATMRDVPIRDIVNLSSRAETCLTRSKLETLGMLIDFLQDNDLMSLKGIGSQTYDEIMAFLQTPDKIQIKNSASDDISSIFCENRFHKFVEYCEKRELKKLSDLAGFKFELLLEEPGFGIGKYNAVKQKYQQSVKTTENERIQGGKESTHADLITVFPGNENLNISFLKYAGISSSSIKKYIENGYSKIGQLNALTSQELVYLFVGSDKRQKELNKLKAFEQPLSQLVACSLEQEKSGQEREYQIALRAIRGETFQQIGETMEVKRQRVHQKYEEFSKRYTPLFEAISEQRMLESESRCISSKEILELLNNNEDFCLIGKELLKKSPQYEYLPFAELFVQTQGNEKRIEDKLDEIAKELIGEDGYPFFDCLPEVKRILQEAGLDYISTDNFLEFLNERGVTLEGNRVFLKRRGESARIIGLVREHFSDGIKYVDGNAINQLREYARESGEPLRTADNTIRNVLSEKLYTWDRGVVTTEDSFRYEPSTIEEIKQYIDGNDQQSFYYSSIFGKYEGILRFTSNITNQYRLHGLLSYLYPDEYDFSRDQFTKKCSVANNMALGDRISAYIKEQARPISKKELKNNFAGLSDIMLINAVAKSTSMIQWDSENFYNMECLKISEEDKKVLHETIERQFSQHKNYCSDSLVYKQAKQACPEFISKNNIENASNLFHILQKLFDGEMQFSKPHICKAGEIEQLTSKSVVWHLLGNDTRISRKKFETTAQELLWNERTSAHVFKSIEQEYVRITEDEYLRREHFQIEEKALSEIQSWIDKKVSAKGYLSMIGYENFDMLPEIGYAWNSFLLVSIIQEHPLGYKIVSPVFSNHNYNKGIIVSEKSPFETVPALVANILQKNGCESIAESEMLSFLIVNHLAMKTIPHEFYKAKEMTYKDGIFWVKG